MNPEIKAKWIAALRSGKYKQGKFYLNTNARFCCLGVLCDVVDPARWADDDVWDHKYYTSEFGARLCETLPASLRKSLNIEDTQTDVLIDLNDNKSKSFNEIADYIEANL